MIRKIIALILIAFFFLVAPVFAGVQFVYPKFQAYDGNGNPLDGGFLYTYAANSSTAKATYSDKGLTAANTNPVVLNARGEAVVYGTGQYKFILRDSAGSLIWTFDYLDGIGGYLGGNFCFPDAGQADQGAAVGSVTVKDFVDAIGAAKTATIVFSRGSTGNNTDYIFLTSETITSNITCQFEQGARVSIATTKTLTLPSPSNIIAQPGQQIFSGAGTVVFPSGGKVHPGWWGTDGTADDVQINAALESISKGTVELLPDKTYYTTGTIDIKTGRKNLLGAGQQSTIIRFTPSSNIPAVHLCDPTPAVIPQNRIGGFAISGAGNTQTKVGIRITDSEETVLEDIAISNFTSTGIDCIGLQLRGRQTNTIRNILIYTDIPISIEQNPNGSIDIDHYHFQDCYLIGTDLITNPLIRVADGVNLTHVLFDGYQAWARGTHGFYWNDTTTTESSIGLVFKNVRLEQQTSVTAYMFYIAHNSNLRGLIFENIYGGLHEKGYYLRKCAIVKITNSHYINGAANEALNVDATVTDLTLITNFWQTGTTISMPGQKLVSGVRGLTGPLPVTGVYSTRVSACSLVDAPQTGVDFTLADNGTAKLCAETFAGHVFIATSQNLTALFAIVGGTHTTRELLDWAASFSITAGTAGSVNLYWSAGNAQYEIENKMGVSITFYLNFLGAIR